MKDKQWVQHISGQGEKWEVKLENEFQWGCESKQYGFDLCWLPKTEYRLCDPPERWEDVTGECSIDEDGPTCQLVKHNGDVRFVTAWYGRNYRLCKVKLLRQDEKFTSEIKTQWAFIVEKKVQP